MSGTRYCSNGHMMFDTKDGIGCLKPGCPSRIVRYTPPPKRKKSGPKPKEKS